MITIVSFLLQVWNINWWDSTKSHHIVQWTTSVHLCLVFDLDKSHDVWLNFCSLCLFAMFLVWTQLCFINFINMGNVTWRFVDILVILPIQGHFSKPRVCITANTSNVRVPYQWLESDQSFKPKIVHILIIVIYLFVQPDGFSCSY